MSGITKVLLIAIVLLLVGYVTFSSFWASESSRYATNSNVSNGSATTLENGSELNSGTEGSNVTGQESNVEMPEDAQSRQPGDRLASGDNSSYGRTRSSASNEMDSLRERVRQSDALSTERRLLAFDQIDASAASTLLPADDGSFEDALHALSIDMTSDPLAAEINDIYSQALNAYTAQSGDERSLGRLACGLRLCLAEAYSSAEDPAWRTWLSEFSNHPDAPPVFVTMGAEIDSGNSQGSFYRMLLSIDPDSGGAYVPTGGLPSP